MFGSLRIISIIRFAALDISFVSIVTGIYFRKMRNRSFLGIEMEISCYAILVAFWITTYLDISLACETGRFEFRTSCYYFSQGTSDFYSSKSSCEELGMRVVEIESQEEQDFLVAKIQESGASDEGYWIGLTAITWLDGTRLTYDNFGSIQKGAFNEGSQCFRIYAGSSSYLFRWFDDDCSDTNYYICEAEKACDEFESSHDLQFHEFEGSCYYISSNEVNFSTSMSNCEFIGMHLVFIVSQSEQDSIVGMIELLDHEYPKEYWIGLTDLDWSEDGSGLPYHNFDSDSAYSFNNGRVCYRMDSDYQFKWLDDDCHDEYYSICENIKEQEASDDPTTPTTSATTEKVTASEASSSRQPLRQKSAYFKLVADDTKLEDAYVTSTHHAISTLIECALECHNDTTCSCFTYIAKEEKCLLGNCIAVSNRENRQGAKTYYYI
ncbi:macrophage mannose receptor 1-like [Lytechinus variegatus]|uniref:macrophage mannose receptor 1-like n=1 Tax=Lytechinus variegatus TaxID=7654 RepID=UPI001BB22AB6|nr:macrophage mannose receptor 1-like [Lytechinus variegatus]